MNKYECSYQKDSDCWTYYAIVIADDKKHAAQMATGCVSRSNYFPSNVDTDYWNVSLLDTGYSGDAKVVDYSKR